MIVVYHLIALTVAVLIDRLIGDPRSIPHPVVWIGKLISLLEKNLNKGSYKKAKGLLLLAVVVVFVFFLTFIVVVLAYTLHPVAGILVEAFLISFAIAQRSLKEAALEVYSPLKEGNVVEARVKLSYIVGRDTDKLKEKEIVRGTVETVAENTSDGVTAPLFFALIGGAPLAMVYRAVNTCDSMVGYKNDKYLLFGWASARFDDLLNYIPSRITGFLMVAVNQNSPALSKRKCFSVMLEDAKKHPSPNSGWGEAAVAGLLGIQLGGTNSYHGKTSERAKMGKPLYTLNKDHILQTITIMNRTVFIFVAVLWLLGGITYAIT